MGQHGGLLQSPIPHINRLDLVRVRLRGQLRIFLLHHRPAELLLRRRHRTLPERGAAAVPVHQRGPLHLLLQRIV